MKTVFRTQRGGFCGISPEEDTTCPDQVPAPPPVIFTVQQLEERERRLRANQQPWNREYYPAPPCVLSIKEREDGS